MFDPAALPCGHILCGRCTMAAAGHANAGLHVRDLQKLRATAGASCPSCRAHADGPRGASFFQAATPLPHLGQLVCIR